MPFVGFEPMIPASETAKTVQALDRLATVTGIKKEILHLFALLQFGPLWISPVA
jgi:hypothetical protein